MSRFKNMKPHKVVADLFRYKMVIAGRPKVGKTSLIHGVVKEKYDGDLSKLLLIAFENGYNALNGIYAENINEWEDFLSLVDDLIDEKDESPFQVLAIDTVDIMSKMATKYVITKQSRKDGKTYTSINDLGYGKGYDLLDTEVSEQLSRLDKAGYSLVFITHDKDKQFETREGIKYDKTTLSLTGRVRDVVLNMADFVVFIENAKELSKGKMIDKRYIHFRGDSGLEAGSRFVNIQEKIEYDYRGFIDAIEEAILKEYNGDVKALESAKQEQEEVYDETVKDNLKNMKEQKENKTQEDIQDVIEKITERYIGLKPSNKKKAVQFFVETLGEMDYRKSNDYTGLKNCLDLVISLEE